MQPQSSPQKPTILLVEDDDDTRRVYCVMLRYAGFTVAEAATGAEAVDRASADIPDLILMDMNLPMFDGWEAARRIKSDPRTSAAPLIAFSATIDSVADLRRGNALFDGFIAKPVSPSELVRRVVAYLDLLRRVNSPTTPTLRRRVSGTSSPQPAPAHS
jgi:two-component system cell cycle response regulator DivK